MKFKKKGLFCLLIISCWGSLFADPAVKCVDWPNADFQPTPNPQTKMIAPDYGIYWFKMGAGQFPEEAKKAYTSKTVEPMFADGTLNQSPGPQQILQYQLAKTQYNTILIKQHFFDPNAPTLIFIHGWSPTDTQHTNRFDLCYQYKINDTEYSPLYNTLEYWKSKGWNVGVFFWNQFADEAYIPNAESKLYEGTDKEEPRWKYIASDGSIQYCSSSLSKNCMPIPLSKNGGPSSITELAYAAYLDAFPDNYNAPVRIAGFSLGSQIAIGMTDMIVHNKQAVQPSQLILLDSYLSMRKVPKLIFPTYQIVTSNLLDIINTTKHQNGVASLPISLYRGSSLSTLAYLTFIKNPAIANYVAYTRFYPDYLYEKGSQLAMAQHIATAYLYLQSMNTDIPVDCTAQDNCTPFSHVIASSNDEEIHLMQGLTRFQVPSALGPKHDESEHDFAHTQQHRFLDNADDQPQ